jgi:hypothetical protein
LITSIGKDGATLSNDGYRNWANLALEFEWSPNRQSWRPMWKDSESSNQ